MSKSPAHGARRSNIGRLNEIVAVLVRHGLGDLVRRWGMADALEKAGHRLHWDHAADLAHLSPPVQVRKALEELGPTFVKLGQILAGRADMFGPEWIAEFEQLHSHVPPVPFESLRAQLRADLGGEPEDVFAHFDTEPLAAASIAQVHRARLKDGTEVIVKIRRPGIRDVIDADLRLLDRLAALAEAELPALAPYRPRLLLREFGRSLHRELDLATECRHAERLARNMVALPFIVIPRTHWDYTRERVNVQDYVQGIPGHDLAALDAGGFDRKLLAQRGAHAVLKMIVEDGFFHADPHPGNVFYLPEHRLAFIDFGMVGHLSMRRRQQLLKLLLGLVQRQPQTVVDVLLEWTRDGQAVPAEKLENDLEAFIDQYHGLQLSELSLGQMLLDVTTILRENHLALPPDLALLIKTFITLEGLGRGLDPDFNMAGEALPLLRQVVRARYQPKVLAKRALTSMQRLLEVTEQLPQDISRLMRNARLGRLNIGLEIQSLKRVGNQLDRAANRLSLALIIAALIIGSSIVMTVGGGPTLLGLPAFGLLGFVGAGLGALWLGRAIWRSTHHKDEEL
jgi:ubiquinone biosynthesis protein